MRTRLLWRAAAAALLCALAAVPAAAQVPGTQGTSPPYFEAFFDTPGTYSQIVPANLYRLYVDACSGGGAGSSANGAAAFGGGSGAAAACLVRYPLPVTPGQTLTVTVGAAGTPGVAPTVTTISGTGINFPTVPAGASAAGTSGTGATAASLGATAAPYLIAGTSGGNGSGVNGDAGETAGASGLFPGGAAGVGTNGSGGGGSSAFGPGANGVGGVSNGNTPTGYGGGGSGCAGTNPVACTAGSGAPGFVHLSSQ